MKRLIATAVASITALMMSFSSLSASANPPDSSEAELTVGANVASSEQENNKVPSLIPLPAQLTVAEDGTPFKLNTDTTIVADQASNSVAKTLSNELKASTGYPFQVANSGTSNIIKLQVDSGLDITKLTTTVAQEAYSLEVSDQGVTIIGRSAHGVWNGTRTLLQLLPAFIYSDTVVNADWTIPDVSILDAPRYEHRAQQIDMARSFLSVDEVKDMIDTLSSVKGNRAHLHLADDQGWRIEITNDAKEDGDTIDYSLLTSRSSETGMVQDSMGWVPDGMTKPEIGHAGYYTQDEYKEIQAYAAERFVEIIPEIDVPGHTNAALYAIPQLNTPGSSHDGTVDNDGKKISDPANYLTAAPNGTKDVGYSYLDPDSDFTKYFLKHVFTQLANITDGDYVHQGGDESHDMAARYSTEKMNEFLSFTSEAIREAGKHPIGWTEIAQNTMQEGDAIQYWVGGTDNVKRAVNEGAKVVVAQSSTAYVDMQYGTPDGNAIGLTWAGVGDFTKYYDWNPTNVISGLTDSDILGVEATQWSETIRGGYQAEWLAYPRVMAIAEIGWTPQAKRNVNEFAARMADMGARLTVMGSNFYDGPNALWSTELAGINTAVSPGRDVQLEIGQFVAPRTKLSGEAAATSGSSVEAITDPAQSSALTQPFSANVDWGDGSEPTQVTFTQDQPRDPVHATGIYTLKAGHSYATTGSYQATIKGSDGRTAKFSVTVAKGTADPQSETPWDSTVEPSVSVDQQSYNANDRAILTVTGFEPGSYVEISWAGQPQFSVKMDAEGKAHYTMPMITTMVSGTQTIAATQGQREATTTATLNGGVVPLQNPIAREAYSVAGFSSEETGESAPNGLATATIDGDKATFWHSKWKSPAATLPHYVTLKLSEASQITGFEYTPRQDSINGLVKEYKIYVSDDGQTWGEPVASGVFANNQETKVVEFDHSKNGQYVKFEIVSNQAGDEFGTIGELRIGGFLGKPSAEPTATSTTKPTPTTEPSNASGSTTTASTNSSGSITTTPQSTQASLKASARPKALPKTAGNVTDSASYLLPIVGLAALLTLGGILLAVRRNGFKD